MGAKNEKALIQLISINFDRIENRVESARYESLIGSSLVKNNESEISREKTELLSKVKPLKYYHCWDGEIYPKLKFRIFKNFEDKTK